MNGMNNYYVAIIFTSMPLSTIILCLTHNYYKSDYSPRLLLTNFLIILSALNPALLILSISYLIYGLKKIFEGRKK